MYRSSSFDEYLSKKMQEPEFAKSFLLELVNNKEEPLSIQGALKEAISVMGVTEFSNLINESKSNVGNFLNGKRKLKQETLDKYLSPFHLRVKLTLEDAA